MSDFPDLLRSLTVDQLRRLEIPEAVARQTAEQLLDGISREYGCERIYVPAPSKAARDRAILAGLASGDSRAAVARRCGVSVATVARVQARHRN